MIINDIRAQLMYITVLLYVIILTVHSTQKRVLFLKQIIYLSLFLITNYYVLKDAERGFRESHLAEKDRPTDKSIKVQFDKTVSNNKLGEWDLVALPITTTFDELFSKNIIPFYRTISADMTPTGGTDE